MKSRRLAALAITTVAAATALPALPASAQTSGGPTILSDRAVTVTAGGEDWVNINWTASSEMKNFRMTITESINEVEISYAGDHSSAGLTNDADLSPGEMDIAAFKLKTTAKVKKDFTLQVVAQWEADGQAYKASMGDLIVRANEYKGDIYEINTDAATVASTGDGSGNWVEIHARGLAPLTENMSFVFEQDKKFPTPYYPQTTFTSLDHDDRLFGGESDVARVWFDPATVTPGTYKMKLIVTYLASDGKLKDKDYDFTLTVN
jgi:hypothetical protein